MTPDEPCDGQSVTRKIRATDTSKIGRPDERAEALFERVLGAKPMKWSVGDKDTLAAIHKALRDERRRAMEEAAEAVQLLTGKDSGNWNRCVVYAVDAIRKLQEPAP